MLQNPHLCILMVNFCPAVNEWAFSEFWTFTWVWSLAWSTATNVYNVDAGGWFDVLYKNVALDGHAGSCKDPNSELTRHPAVFYRWYWTAAPNPSSCSSLSFLICLLFIGHRERTRWHGPEWPARDRRWFWGGWRRRGHRASVGPPHEPRHCARLSGEGPHGQNWRWHRWALGHRFYFIALLFLYFAIKKICISCSERTAHTLFDLAVFILYISGQFFFFF